MAPPATQPAGLLSPAAIDFTLPECPLLLHADEPVVVSTPFLQWNAYPPASPGGPLRVGIPHSRAVKAFIRRCALDPTSANFSGFAMVDCFTFFLNSASWNRIINQLLQSNVLSSSPFTTWPEFLFQLEQLTHQQPSQLQLTWSDIDLGESFDAPAAPGRPAVAATPPRRRGSRGPPPAPPVPAIPAQPPTPGPSAIAFLALVKIDAMIDPTSGSPLESWCDFIGAMSAGRTRASRLSAMATIQIAGMMLRGAVASRLMGSTTERTPDPLIAVHLPDMFREIQLPHCLLPFELSDGEIRAELRDALRAARADSDRRAVELSRIHLSARRAPVFHNKIAALASNNAEIMQHLDRLYVALQSTHSNTEASTAPVTSKLDLVEGILAPRVSALDEFINSQGATAHSVVEAFLAERASANLQPNAPPLTARGGAQTDQTLDSDGIDPDRSAVYRAMALEGFRKMAAPTRTRVEHTAPRQPPPPQPPQHLPSAGSTTGVGCLRHQFPRTLRRYKVYDDRPSTRRAPTVRLRA